MVTVTVLILTALGTAALYFLMASGLTLIFGFMHVLNLSHGALFATGAYVGYAVTTHFTVLPLGARFAAAVVCALVAGVALGFVIERALVRRLYGQEYAQLLLTLGVGLVITGLIGGWFGYDDRQMALPDWFLSSASFGSVRFAHSRILVILLALVALIVILVFLQNTRHGLIIRAGVENRAMVRALGIPVDRSFTMVFCIGAALASFGGLLAGVFYNSLSPGIGSQQLVIGFIVVVVGGLGSVVGSLYAALIVALIEVFADYYIGSGIGKIAVVVMLAVVLIFRPAGLRGRQLA